MPTYGIIPDRDRCKVIKLRNDFYDFRKSLVKQKLSQFGSDKNRKSKCEDETLKLFFQSKEEEKDPFQNLEVLGEQEKVLRREKSVTKLIRNFAVNTSV